MQRGTGGTVFEPVQPERRDREVTIGPFLLTLIGCMLFALCGFCFILGYGVGHRSAESSAAISVPPAMPALTPQAAAQSKPPAAQGGETAQPAAAPADMSEPSETDPAGDATTPSASPAATSPEPAVHAVAASQPLSAPSSTGVVQPALASPATAPAAIMVQIAAVSHPEDADVLVGALRKRGYAVSARRDPSDGLLHVQIGPFARREDAYTMRQKLLNDGYNAIVQP
jgi:DedD protein